MGNSPGHKKEEWVCYFATPKKSATKVSCPFLSFSPFFSFESISEMYLVVKPYVPQTLKKNKVENIGLCIESEVKPLVPTRRRH
jgi:hypothetical protein